MYTSRESVPAGFVIGRSLPHKHFTMWRPPNSRPGRKRSCQRIIKVLEDSGYLTEPPRAPNHSPSADDIEGLFDITGVEEPELSQEVQEPSNRLDTVVAILGDVAGPQKSGPHPELHEVVDDGGV